VGCILAPLRGYGLTNDLWNQLSRADVTTHEGAIGFSDSAFLSYYLRLAFIHRFSTNPEDILYACAF
jgi:hypothetical protein